MTRRGVGLVALVALALVGCSGNKAAPPEPVLITPNSRLIYHDTNGHAVWTTCDRGTRLYLTHDGRFQAVPNGCLNGEP